jgi:ssRNA-specific RNase YbeY (16S rRNA maturation enzyme)
LLGFDDDSKKEKLEMTQMENDFLSQINWQKIFES